MNRNGAEPDGTFVGSWGALLVAFLATVFLLIIVWPMASIILWACILSILYSSTNERLVQAGNGRGRASLLTLLIALLSAVLPFFLVSALVAGQVRTAIDGAARLSQELSTRIDALTSKLPAAIQTGIAEAMRGIEISSKGVGEIILPAASYTLSIGANVGIFLGSVLAIFYVTFYFLRDGREIESFLSRAVPLKPADKAHLSKRLSDTVSATVRGVILVAVAQSTVAGFAYWALGLPIFALLAALTFISSLIPAIGSGLVWVPVAIYFFLIGEPGHGIAMLLIGALVISMVDNLLRPRLIAQKAAMPDFLIFLSSIGGLSVVGFDGLFLGPIVASFFMASWQVYFDSNNKETVAGA